MPKWLRERKDLDEMAQRRCQMILTVLSGERPVTDVITEAQISRQLYYQLEERALRAMLSALMPTSTGDQASLPESPAKKIAALEAKVSRLEQDKRRSERLLFLTRKLLKKGPMTAVGVGRPRKAKSSSTSAGRKPSRVSKNGTGKAPEPTPASSEPSTPMPSGAMGP